MERELFVLFELLINLIKTLHTPPNYNILSTNCKCSSHEVFLHTQPEMFPFRANLLTLPETGFLQKSTNIRKTVCNIVLISIQYTDLNY